MKKKIAVLVMIALAAIFAFAACGKARSPGGDGGADGVDFIVPAGRKIIYTASFTIRCRDFEKSKNIVEKSLEAGEWFDSVSYSDGNARFRARVKTERLDEYISGISSSVGADNINSYRRTATDVSLDYYNKQGQIDALETEHARLLVIMAEPTTTISDLILINTRLSQVEYELQKVNGELNKFDSQLEYSTVDITIEKITYGWVIAVSIIGFIIAAGPVTGLTIWFVKRRKVKKLDKAAELYAYKNNFEQP